MMLGLFMVAAPAPARAQDTDPGDQLREPRLDPQVFRERVYRMNHAHIFEGMRHDVEEARRAEAEQRAAKKKRGRKGAGLAPKAAPPVVQITPAGPPHRLPAEPLSSQLLGLNVRANDTLGDTTSATQSEVSLAAIGDQVLVSWNDGQGFYTPPSFHIQGYAISTDGGSTFTDGGATFGAEQTVTRFVPMSGTALRDSIAIAASTCRRSPCRTAAPSSACRPSCRIPRAAPAPCASGCRARAASGSPSTT